MEQFDRIQSIKIDLFFIVGYPIETDEDFEETIALVQRYKKYIDSGILAHIRVAIMNIHEGAPIWKLKDEIGIKNPTKYDWSSPIVSYETRIARFHELRELINTLGAPMRKDAEMMKRRVFYAGAKDNV